MLCNKYKMDPVGSDSPPNFPTDRTGCQIWTDPTSQEFPSESCVKESDTFRLDSCRKITRFRPKSVGFHRFSCRIRKDLPSRLFDLGSDMNWVWLPGSLESTRKFTLNGSRSIVSTLINISPGAVPLIDRKEKSTPKVVPWGPLVGTMENWLIVASPSSFTMKQARDEVVLWMH